MTLVSNHHVSTTIVRGSFSLLLSPEPLHISFITHSTVTFISNINHADFYIPNIWSWVQPWVRFPGNTHAHRKLCRFKRCKSVAHFFQNSFLEGIVNAADECKVVLELVTAHVRATVARLGYLLVGHDQSHVSANHRVLNAPLNLCSSILSEAIMLLCLGSWGLHMFLTMTGLD